MTATASYRSRRCWGRRPSIRSAAELDLDHLHELNELPRPLSWVSGGSSWSIGNGREKEGGGSGKDERKKVVQFNQFLLKACVVYALSVCSFVLQIAWLPSIHIRQICQPKIRKRTNLASWTGAREPLFNKGESGSKIKFYHVTYDTLIFTPPLEIMLIVNAI